jgi:hypothetical protein
VRRQRRGRIEARERLDSALYQIRFWRQPRSESPSTSNYDWPLFKSGLVPFGSKGASTRIDEDSLAWLTEFSERLSGFSELVEKSVNIWRVQGRGQFRREGFARHHRA